MKAARSYCTFIRRHNPEVLELGPSPTLTITTRKICCCFPSGNSKMLRERGQQRNAYFLFLGDVQFKVYLKMLLNDRHL
jgi:hypothetical protein